MALNLTASAQKKLAEEELAKANDARDAALKKIADLQTLADAEDAARTKVDKILADGKFTIQQLYPDLFPETAVKAARKTPARKSAGQKMKDEKSGDQPKTRSNPNKVYDWVYEADPTKGFEGDKPLGPGQPWHHRDKDNNVDMTKFRKATAAERKAMEEKRDAWEAKHGEKKA